MAYSDLVPVGTVLIISATSFALGAIYGNLPYDFYTLWSYDENGFQNSLAHYIAWANAPMRVHYILHFVIFLGLLGCFIKLYKPHPDVKYFEYATLALMMVGVVIYLTNLRIGINSALAGNWGDVDMKTGINVVAASQFMMVIALGGVLFLQGGLYYAEYTERKLREDFFAKEKAAAAAAAAAATPVVAEASGEASGAQAKKTKAKKRA